MKYEHWQIPAAPEDAIKALMDAGYPYLVSSVLAARGVTIASRPPKRSSARRRSPTPRF